MRVKNTVRMVVFFSFFFFFRKLMLFWLVLANFERQTHAEQRIKIQKNIIKENGKLSALSLNKFFQMCTEYV